jgi:UDP-2,3-diacylglucosamine hydrolase
MPTTKKVYFISDAHLGAPYISGAHPHQRRLITMLRSFSRDASDIYLMGDILDYWYEYRTVAPRGYVRFLGYLAHLADSGIKIHWFTGNHDIWLFDYLRDEIGMEVVTESCQRTILGHEFYLSHGDDMGRQTRGFRVIRSVFRNRFAQFLFSAIHPRWTVPFAHRWSNHSRTHGGPEPYLGADKEPAMIFARQYLAEHPDIEYFVSGHRHIMVDEKLGDRARYIVLGDCYKQFSYGEYDGETFQLKKYDFGEDDFRE